MTAMESRLKSKKTIESRQLQKKFTLAAILQEFWVQCRERDCRNQSSCHPKRGSRENNESSGERKTKKEGDGNGQGEKKHTISKLLHWRKQIRPKRDINLEHLPLDHALDAL